VHRGGLHAENIAQADGVVVTLLRIFDTGIALTIEANYSATFPGYCTWRLVWAMCDHFVSRFDFRRSMAASTSSASQAQKPAEFAPDTLQQLLNPPKAEAPLPDVVAVVEGKDIKKEELEQALATVLAGQGIPADQLPAAQKAEGYKMLLNELVLEKLVSSRASAVEVKDEQVDARIEQIKSRFPSPEAFEEQLKKAGQTVGKLREDVTGSIRQQEWVESQIKDAPQATDKEAEEFFQKNPQQFEKAEQVRASHILVALQKDAEESVVAEKKKAAEAIVARVKAGEAFDKLAAELSEDPSAKQNSGDLNFFTKEQMVPEFSQVAFSMKKGDLSDPVRSQFGFHVIQVTDRKDGEKMTLESVKPQLLIFLNRQKHDQEVQKLLQSVREKADVQLKLQ
jgi:parvulin-like peptidyl-prolyl isomerase